MLQALKHWSMQLDFPGFNNDARIAGTYLYFLVGKRRCKSCASFPRNKVSNYNLKPFVKRAKLRNELKTTRAVTIGTRNI